MAPLSTLLFITRPWSFPVTVCAISIGGSLAFVDAPERFSWLFFFLSLTGALFVHAAVNLINTLGDYTKGVDVKGSADDRALVDGMVTFKEAYRLTVFCVAVACVILAGICYTLGQRPAPLSLQGRTLSTPIIDFLILCACGFFVGYAYTGPPFWCVTHTRAHSTIHLLIPHSTLIHYWYTHSLTGSPALSMHSSIGGNTEGLVICASSRDTALCWPLVATTASCRPYPPCRPSPSPSSPAC
jgi:hypothetical protein